MRLTTIIATLLLTLPLTGFSQNPDVFELLNTKITDKDSLVTYFRNRTGISFPGFDPTGSDITPEEQKWADDALKHIFFVHSGYQPSYFYGDDINWQYWPVKDNELRWQLHRMKWWVPLGKAYRQTGDEKYAKEWTEEFVDWIRKNPLGDYKEADAKNLLTADNMYFAWRPLEVSDRLEMQIKQFILFLPSEYFTGNFLSEFLINYHRQCRHIMAHFSKQGNHLLFQAQRLLSASIFFPEFKDAPVWRAKAIEILNTQIAKQVYPDGMQYELDPHYHLESINIFFNALRICDANGLRAAFPQSYIATVHKMIEVVYNYSYPDYANPMFSDFHGQHEMIPLYEEWAKVFPDDGMITWQATKGKEGKTPDYLSREFPVSGIYCLRNGWTSEATVMIMKAGPKGEWHCQPDNGTFEYWRKGRNFFPDSGGYVYSGDEEVNKQRAWFRQTSVHNTLTLDDRNLDTTQSHCLSWTSDSSFTIVSVLNPSYEGLTHKRTVTFAKDGSVLIVDTASGTAEGKVAVHYNLLECDPKEDYENHTLRTTFKDGNNISLCVMSPSKLTMLRKEGKVSFSYKHYNPRPAYSFSLLKRKGETVTFVTLIKPSSE